MKIENLNQDISIIKDYSSGSNATTILCMDKNSTFIRKYALGKAGDKLFQQIEWLLNNNSLIALPEIIKYKKTVDFCFYDMSYNCFSVDLYECSHSMPINQMWRVLLSVVEQLENTIYQYEKKKTNMEVMHAYYEEKVRRNIEYIIDCEPFKELYGYDYLEINGKTYRNISSYFSLLSEDMLKSIIGNDPCSVIHGDLTLENIICTRDEVGNDSFYLIDPNIGNYHDSKYLDYAKILQSLHGEYECIKSSENVKVSQNRISFTYTQSVSYGMLYELYKSFLQEYFDECAINSIYYHEIIHWLRLLPYQIRNNSSKAVVFYSRLLMLLDEFIYRCGEKI